MSPVPPSVTFCERSERIEKTNLIILEVSNMENKEGESAFLATQPFTNAIIKHKFLTITILFVSTIITDFFLINGGITKNYGMSNSAILILEFIPIFVLLLGISLFIIYVINKDRNFLIAGRVYIFFGMLLIILFYILFRFMFIIANGLAAGD